MLVQQHQADEARHRTDLQRIAELEGFISSVLEDYKRQEEKLRLGHFRKGNSVKVLDDARSTFGQLNAVDPTTAAVNTALENELRKLQPLINQKV